MSNVSADSTAILLQPTLIGANSSNTALVGKPPTEELSLIEFIESDENLDADLGEMDPMQVIDFLVEQNKKLWNERIKFENYSLSLNHSLEASEQKLKKLGRYKKAVLQEQEEKEKYKAKCDELEKELKKSTSLREASSLSLSASMEQLQFTIAQLQLKAQQSENEKKKISLYAFKAKTKIKEIKLDHKNLKTDIKMVTNRFLDDFQSLSTDLQKHVSVQYELAEDQYYKLEQKFSNFMKESEDQVRETAGYLLKVGKTVKSWKRRWFVFRRDLTFSYFKTVEDVKPLDTVDVSMEDALECSADISQGKPFAFKLVTTNRTYFLCATNEDEKRRWISVLRRWFEVNKSYLDK